MREPDFLHLKEITSPTPAHVSREEFDALKERVNALEKFAEVSSRDMSVVKTRQYRDRFK